MTVAVFKSISNIGGALLLCFFFTACSVSQTASEQTTGVADTSVVNSTSKDKIGERCMIYFDGCNQCRRASIGGPAACTKKYCQSYKPAECLKMADSEK